VTRRRLLLVLGLVAAALIGGIVAVVVRGGSTAPVSPAPPPVATATVQRTDLRTTVLTEGTLGYAASAPVVNRLSGTYTELAPAGSSIGFGQVLYRVDDQPVVLFQGAIPAWRPFVAGMSDGPDVSQLQSDLIALGDAAGLLAAPDGHFGTTTLDAVSWWQHVEGLPPSGQIGLGQIVFLPQAVIVGAANSAPGQPAAPGDAPFAVTTTARLVTVPLNPNLPVVSVGEIVSIVLSATATTPGRVTFVGPAPPTTGTQPSSSGGGQSQTAATIATVVPSEPAVTGAGTDVPVQVSLTTQSVRGVLAVPIAALLALSGGGYGIEVVDASGLHHLVGVTTGIFTGSQVQIAGSGIGPGTRVVVAQ
jgi:peptidoglycan hydrolase-like protein with peptidoglycan-binding domain